MDEWYGEHKKVGDGKHLRLKEVNMNFFSEEKKVYHNSYESSHYFHGHLVVEGSLNKQEEFKPFNSPRYTPTTYEFTVELSRLPVELKEELKQIWLKIEKAMVGEFNNEK